MLLQHGLPGPLFLILLRCHSPLTWWSTASFSLLFIVGKDDWTNQRMPQVEALFQDTIVDLALVARALRQLNKDFQPAAIPGGVAQRILCQCFCFQASAKKLAKNHAACS